MLARPLPLAAAIALAAAASAAAQQGGAYSLTWSTIDGGGRMWSAGGDYALGGTIGQGDAGSAGASAYACDGGFWPGAARRCAADFDANGTLTLNDFVTFRNLYVAGDQRADFDGSGALTLNDFVQFRNAYAAGCP